MYESYGDAVLCGCSSDGDRDGGGHDDLHGGIKHRIDRAGYLQCFGREQPECSGLCGYCGGWDHQCVSVVGDELPDRLCR